MIGNKPHLRRYSFEFSCLLHETTSNARGESVRGFLEGAHFFVEIDFTQRANDLGEEFVAPPDYSKAVERIEDLIERRFEGCPIFATPLGIGDEFIEKVEALTAGRAYLLRDLSSDTFAHKFFDMGALHEANVSVEEVRVRRAGDDYTAICRETDDEA